MLRLITLFVPLLLLSEPAPQLPGQPKWTPQNLQYFPKDIKQEQIVQRMREFSFALGVRCQYCHAGGDGVSLEGVNFGSDEKPTKLKARAMLRMVDQINGPVLAALPTRAEPKVTVDCVTCHRGLPLPKTLQTTLLEIVNKDGAAAATARYRELRTNQTLTGRWNFGEWEINELARRLRDVGNLEAAIAILEMNGEFNPKSAEIDFYLGEMHLARGEKDKALSRYRAALEKAPNHAPAKARIAELEKK
jgi:photosynthetic reaction center cytochrome c subunit